MKHSMKKITALAMSGLMAASLLTGCGGSASSQATQASSDPAGSAEESSAAQTDGTGEAGEITINYGVPTEWHTVNPMSNSSNGYTWMVGNMLFCSPVSRSVDGSTFEPEAAESWEMADDQMSITFHLRQDLTFSDGEPVTADDWVYSFNLLANPAAALTRASYISSFVGTDGSGFLEEGSELGIDVEDDYTLTIHLKQPTGEYAFFDALVVGSFVILPEHLLAENDPADVESWDFWKTPVSSGPCTFVAENSGTQLLLQARKDYPIGDIQFDYINVLVSDTSVAPTSIMAGEIDFYAYPLSYSVVQTIADTAGITCDYLTSSASVSFLRINNDEVPKEVRKALDYATDKQLLVDTRLDGYGETTGTNMMESSKWYIDIDEGVQLEKAKELLDSVNFDYENRPIRLALSGNDDTSAVILSQMWEQIGVKTEITLGDLSTITASLREGDLDMIMVSATYYDNTTWSANRNFIEGNNWNIDTSIYADAMNTYNNTSDEAEKKAASDELIRLVYDNAPIIYLYHKYPFYAHADWMSNWTDGGYDECYRWVIDTDTYQAYH